MFTDITLIIIIGIGGMLLIVMLACYCLGQAPAPAQMPEPVPEAQPPTETIDLDQVEEGFGFESDFDSLGLVYGTECSICCEVMDGKTTIGRIKRCKHSFHRACVMQWYRTRIRQGYIPSCPTCRDTDQQLILTKVYTPI